MFQYFKQKLHSDATEAETMKNAASPKSQKSRKNFLIYVVIATLSVAAVFTSCGGGGGSGSGKSSGKIKMTTEQGGDFGFSLKGSGVATVDWGDGSEKVTLTLNEDREVEFKHTYPSATIRTININGDNITGLFCKDITSLDVSRCTELTVLRCNSYYLKSLDVSKNIKLTTLSCLSYHLTSLDVSKNTMLEKLACHGIQLTTLDLSKNTVLTDLYFDGNQLTAAALNALFGTLHSNAGKKLISIDNNPGSKDCDRSIAERKGWRVEGY